MTHSYPRETYSDPKVAYSDPKVTLHTSPYLHLPHLAITWPLVKCIETSGWVVVVVVVVVAGDNQL